MSSHLVFYNSLFFYQILGDRLNSLNHSHTNIYSFVLPLFVSIVNISFCKVKKDDKYGIVDGDGKTVIQAQYADIDVLGKDNKSGFIIKNADGKYGIVDYSNAQILEAKYDSIEKVYGNDMYVVNLNGKQKVVNKSGNDVLTTGFDSIKQILANQENAVIFVKSNKFGVMNTSGEVVTFAQAEQG